MLYNFARSRRKFILDVSYLNSVHNDRTAKKILGKSGNARNNEVDDALAQFTLQSRTFSGTQAENGELSSGAEVLTISYLFHESTVRVRFALECVRV